MKLTIPEIKQLVKELLTESDVIYLMEQEAADFGRVIQTAQAGDDFEVRVKVPVTHAGIEVFTPGRVYKGKVKKNGTDIIIQRNSLNPFDTDPDARGITEMAKEEFIEILEEKAKEEDKEPCEIVNCEKSIIIRGDKRKTFSEYFKNPTFKKAEAETEEEAEEAAAPTEEKCQSGRAPGWQCKEMGYPHPEDPAEKAAGDQTEAELATSREGWEPGGHKRYKRADFGEFKTPMHRWTPPTLPGMEGSGAAGTPETPGQTGGVAPLGSPPSYDVLYSIMRNDRKVQEQIRSVEKKLKGILPWGERAAEGETTLKAEWGFPLVHDILIKGGYRPVGGVHPSKWKYYGKKQGPIEDIPGFNKEQNKRYKDLVRKYPNADRKNLVSIVPDDEPTQQPTAAPKAPQTTAPTAQSPVKSHRVTRGQGYYQILRDLGLLKGLARPQARALIQKLKSAFGGRMITTKDVVHVDADGNFKVEGRGRQLEENKSFSSFPEYQNFFKSWSKYLNEE